MGMINSLSRETPVIVQGITGRMGRTHAALMRAYGTNIVGGTSTRTDTRDAAGVPVFAGCCDAGPGDRRGRLGGDGAAAGDTGRGGGGTGRRHQADRHGGRGRAAARRDEDRPRGPPGRARHGSAHPRPAAAIPGEIKLGFLPDVCLRPGPLAIMSKSGTLSYEVGYRLAHEGLGQSIWVGVGGDPVKGVRFADLLPKNSLPTIARTASCWSARSAATRKRNAPMRCRSSAARKPVYALIAGREAKEGVSMGHAGALVFGEVGTFASKTQRLTAAGAHVFGSIETLVQACAGDFQALRT